MSTDIQSTETGAKEITQELTNRSTGAFLSKEQRDYAIGRVNELVNKQLKAFEAKNPHPFKTRPGQNLDEKLVLLKTSKVKMIDLKDLKKACQLPFGDQTLWDKMFVWPKTPDQEAYDAVTKKLETFSLALFDRRDTAIDQIMLGTGAEANKFIAEFGPDGIDPRQPNAAKV